LLLVVFSFTSRLRRGGATLYDNAQASPAVLEKKNMTDGWADGRTDGRTELLYQYSGLFEIFFLEMHNPCLSPNRTAHPHHLFPSPLPSSPFPFTTFDP